MPRVASKEREREYKNLVNRFHEEDRYPGREEEVAARIVNKQRSEHSETRAARADDRKGVSPDRDLPIARYDHLTVEQIIEQLEDSSDTEIRAVRDYEESHRQRHSLLLEIERLLR